MVLSCLSKSLRYMYHISFSFNLSMECFFGLFLFTAGSSPAVNVSACAIWMMLFCIIGSGVGIKILGLAVLKFSLLPVELSFLGAVANVHSHGTCTEFHHFLVLSISCLLAVRITILSGGIWLLVILIGILSVIIRDAAHLVLWLFGFFLFFFP